MSACVNRLELLNALMDGELDAANSAELEAHIINCAGCDAELRELREIRSRLADPRLRYRAPVSLRNKVDVMLAQSSRPTFAGAVRGTKKPANAAWFAVGAVTSLAASIALFVALPQFFHDTQASCQP